MISSRSVAFASRRSAVPSVGRACISCRPVPVCNAIGKGDLIDSVIVKTGMSKKDATAAFAAVLSSIEESVASGERVTVIGFGTFEVRERAARTCRNPKTGEAIEVAASKSPAFKPAPAFKDLVNGSVKAKVKAASA